MIRSTILNKYNNMPIPLRASIWYFFSAFLQKGITVLSTPVFTRILTTEEYGTYGVFSSWSSIIAVFLTLRMYYGVYAQGLVKFSNNRDKFSSSLIGLTSTLVFIGVVIYSFFSDYLNKLFNLTTPMMFAMFLTIWTEAIFSFWAGRQRIEYKYKHLVLLTIAVSILNTGFGIVAVFLSDNKVLARVWEIAIVEFILYIGLFVSQLKKGMCFFDKDIWKYALAFSLPLVPHYLSQTVLNSSDRIMIERMIGFGPAGIYTLAYSVSQLMLIFNTVLSQTISPWIYQKIKSKEIDAIKTVGNPSILLVGTVNIVLICFAPEAIRLFGPEDYYAAVWIIPPVAMSVYFTHLYNLFAMFEFYYEKTGFIALSTGVAAVLNIVLNFIFLRIFGYYAAGYTTLLSYIIYATMHFWFSKKLCLEHAGLPSYDTKTILGYSAVFVFIGFYFMFTYLNTLIRFISIAFLLCICFIYRKRIIKYVQSLIARDFR